MIQYIISHKNNHNGTQWFVKGYKGIHKEIEYTIIMEDAGRFNSHEEIADFLNDTWWESLNSIRGNYKIETIIV